MKTEIVIIGSGIAGLTCAAILACHGRRVTLVESKHRLGGALKQFKREGIAYDVGFHYTGCLGKSEILQQLWSYCGVLPHIEIQPFPDYGHDQLLIDGFSEPVRAFFSYERFSEELKRLFPDQHHAIDCYFTAIQTFCNKIPFYNHTLPLTDYLHGYHSRPRSLKHFITSLTKNKGLQTVFYAPSFLYGVPVDQASFETHALVAHGYYSGAYGVTGGGQAIVNGFQKVLTDMGVTFLTNTHVRTIETENSRLSGVVTTEKGSIPCDTVIYTGHPSLLVNLVDPACFRPAYLNRLRSLRNSMSMFALFGTIERTRESRQLDWINHFLLPQPPHPIVQSDQNPPSFPSLLLTSTERGQEDTALQSKRKSVILLAPANWEDVRKFQQSRKTARPAAYQELKTTITTHMKQTAEHHWGDLCGPIEPLATGTPLTFRDELLAPEGGAYGAMHGLDQFNPDIRTRLKGLLLAGQSTLMTGVAGASLSGMVSAGEILGLESLWETIRQCN